MTDLAHQATIECAAAADIAYAYLADGERIGEWTLGTWGAERSVADTYCGTSVFDGSHNYVRVLAEPDLRLVDFHVGSEPQSLSFRISARVISGEILDRSNADCVVTLTAWRPAWMDDVRWERLCAAHEVEVLILREKIEAAAPSAPGSRP